MRMVYELEGIRYPNHIAKIVLFFKILMKVFKITADQFPVNFSTMKVKLKNN